MDLTAIPSDIPAQPLFFQKGAYILSDLEENHHFFILLEGLADVMYLGPDGEDMRVYRYQPVDFFGEVEILTDHCQPLPVIAAADCRVLRLAHRDVLTWMERDFALSRHMMKRMCQKMLDDMTGRTQIRYLTQKQRYLLAMDAHARAGTLPALTKESLCQELSIPLRSLNRIIAQCAGHYHFEKGRFSAAT